MAGKNIKDPKFIEKVDKQVEAKVKQVVDELRISHEKFNDPDFGPNEKDEFGVKALYGDAILISNTVLYYIILN